jgi:hypothetical protein
MELSLSDECFGKAEFAGDADLSNLDVMNY